MASRCSPTALPSTAPPRASPRGAGRLTAALPAQGLHARPHAGARGPRRRSRRDLVILAAVDDPTARDLSSRGRRDGLDAIVRGARTEAELERALAHPAPDSWGSTIAAWKTFEDLRSRSRSASLPGSRRDRIVRPRRAGSRRRPTSRGLARVGAKGLPGRREPDCRPLPDVRRRDARPAFPGGGRLTPSRVPTVEAEPVRRRRRTTGEGREPPPPPPPPPPPCAVASSRIALGDLCESARARHPTTRHRPLRGLCSPP